jgi:hypothetical protein
VFDDNVSSKSVYDGYWPDWEVAIEFNPELEIKRKRLSKISSGLGNTFVVNLLETKKFDGFKDLANQIEVSISIHIFW